MSKEHPATLTDRLRQLMQAPLNRGGGFLAGLGIHPDMVTIAGLMMVAVASVLIAAGLFLAGGILLLLSLPLDALDGAVARALNRKGAFGMVLDSTLDRYADGFIFASLGYYFATQDRFDMLVLALLALVGSFLVSYIRARAEDAKVGLQVTIGLLTRVERVTIILVMILAAGLLENPIALEIGIVILAIGTHWTAWQRLLFVYRALRDRGECIFGGMIGAAFGVYLYLSRWHNRIINLFVIVLTPILWLGQFLNWLVNMLIGRAAGKDAAAFRYQRPVSDFPDEGMRKTPWMDIAGVSIPIGQAIGRFANYVNQELYGSPTTLPWGIQIPRGARVAPYESMIDYPADTLFHPLWAYEALWSLIAFYVLWRIYHQYRDRLLSGDILLLYLMQYSFVRFLLEFLRVEIAVIGDSGINSSQTITLLAFAASLALFVYRHRPQNFEAAKAADNQAEQAELSHLKAES